MKAGFWLWATRRKTHLTRKVNKSCYSGKHDDKDEAVIHSCIVVLVSVLLVSTD